MTRWMAAWIACVAVLFAALAPSVTHAFPVQGGLELMDICTANGPGVVTVSVADEGLPKSVSEKLSHFEHCPFCSSHDGGSAVFPAQQVALPAPGPADSHPRLFYQAPSTLTIWAPAQSRAPPSQA